MNVTRWREMTNYILAHPKNYHQGLLAIPRYVKEESTLPVHPCGTCCCIAGTVVALHHAMLPHERTFVHDDLYRLAQKAAPPGGGADYDTLVYAADLLGINACFAFRSIFHEDVSDEAGMEMLRATATIPDAKLESALAVLMVAWNDVIEQGWCETASFVQAMNEAFAPYYCEVVDVGR